LPTYLINIYPIARFWRAKIKVVKVVKAKKLSPTFSIRKYIVSGILGIRGTLAIPVKKI